MKVIYQLNEEIYSEIESTIVPRMGDSIFIQEYFFVVNVVWHPMEDAAVVFISDELPRNRTQVSETRNINVTRGELESVKDAANKALKETATLKRNMSALKQRIEYQNRTKDKS